MVPRSRRPLKGQFSSKYKESKYPILEVSGTKNHALIGIWDRSPKILRTF